MFIKFIILLAIISSLGLQAQTNVTNSPQVNIDVFNKLPSETRTLPKLDIQNNSLSNPSPAGVGFSGVNLTTNPTSFSTDPKLIKGFNPSETVRIETLDNRSLSLEDINRSVFSGMFPPAMDDKLCKTDVCRQDSTEVLAQQRDLWAFTVLQNCACFGGRELNRATDEAAKLKEVCECYTNQKTLAASDLKVSIEAMKVDLAKSLPTQTANNINNLMAYIHYGPQAQALFISDDKKNLGSSYAMAPPQITLEPSVYSGAASGIAAGVSAVSISAQDTKSLVTETLNDHTVGKHHISENKSERSNSNSPLIAMPTAKSIAPVLDEVTSNLTAESCLSMRQFLLYKQIPKAQEFYDDLASVKSETVDPNDWNIQKLMKNLSDTITNLPEDKIGYDDPAAIKIKERIRFLFANPLYAQLLSNPDPGLKESRDLLLAKMKKNLLPDCPSKQQILCAVRNAKNKAAEDRNFFDDPKIISAIRNNTSNGVVDWIGEVLKDGNKNLYTARPILPSVTLRTSSSNIGPERVINACARVAIYSQQNLSEQQEFQMEGPSSAITKFGPGQLQMAEFTNALAEEFDLNKSTNEDFKSMQKFVCEKKHCPSESLFCPEGVAKDLKTFMAESKRQCRDEDCWMKAEKDFLSSYSTVQGSRVFIAQAQDNESILMSEFLGKSKAMGMTVKGIAQINESNNRPPPVVQSSFVKITPPSQNSGSRSSSQPSFQVVSRPTVISTSSNGSIVASAPASLTSLTAALPVVSDVKTASLTDPSAVVANMPFAPSMAASIPAFASPEKIESLGHEIQNARSESDTFETQADALVSSRANASSDLERKALDAQISALSARADAADARAKLLEDQLKLATAKKQSDVLRAPASVADAAASAERKTVAAPSIASPASSIAQPQALSNSQFQNFGSGSSSVNIPVSLPQSAVSRGGTRGSTGVSNFNFKYNQGDSKLSGDKTSAAGIIVAGASSTFDATADLARAVNGSPAVDIGAVPVDVGQRLGAKDIPTIAQYAEVIRAQPGSIIRLTYSQQGSEGLRELLVGKAADGTLFFPAVKNLALRRLEQLNAVISSR